MTAAVKQAMTSAVLATATQKPELRALARANSGFVCGQFFCERLAGTCWSFAAKGTNNGIGSRSPSRPSRHVDSMCRACAAGNAAGMRAVVRSGLCEAVQGLQSSGRKR